MDKDDAERQHLSPPPHHYIRRKTHRLRAILDLLQKPSFYAFTLLLILFFVLGYFSHHYSYPLISAFTAGNGSGKGSGDGSGKGSGDGADDHNNFPGECAGPQPPETVRQTIIDRVFNHSSPWEGFPPAHAKPLLVESWTKGWGSTGAVFENLFLQVRPKTVIEIGTFLGASAIHMAGLAKKLGLDTQIICIDDFRGWPEYVDDEGKGLRFVNGDSMLLYQFMQNVVQANATDSVMFMPFSTTTAFNGLCKWGVYGDLVEIDADHEFHSAWMDINNGYKLVRRPDGVLFGHDYGWEGVRRAVHLFARLHGLQVRLDGEHWILY